jgi:hypothetical protein
LHTVVGTFLHICTVPNSSVFVISHKRNSLHTVVGTFLHACNHLNTSVGPSALRKKQTARRFFPGLSKH